MSAISWQPSLISTMVCLRVPIPEPAWKWSERPDCWEGILQAPLLVILACLDRSQTPERSAHSQGIFPNVSLPFCTRRGKFLPRTCTECPRFCQSAER